ncbi:MAG: hypothetical protein IPP22_15620 [Nitrosomonas sp.]|nr:hypothetical protein [Nitrosomonas sp.]
MPQIHHAKVAVQQPILLNLPFLMRLPLISPAFAGRVRLACRVRQVDGVLRYVAISLFDAKSVIGGYKDIYDASTDNLHHPVNICIVSPGVVAVGEHDTLISCTSGDQFAVGIFKAEVAGHSDNLWAKCVAGSGAGMPHAASSAGFHLTGFRCSGSRNVTLPSQFATMFFSGNTPRYNRLPDTIPSALNPPLCNPPPIFLDIAWAGLIPPV